MTQRCLQMNKAVLVILMILVVHSSALSAQAKKDTYGNRTGKPITDAVPHFTAESPIFLEESQDFLTTSQAPILLETTPTLKPLLQHQSLRGLGD